jgi:hypothetical protein
VKERGDETQFTTQKKNRKLPPKIPLPSEGKRG